MRIKSIHIQNYRQYKEFEHSFDKVKGIDNDLSVIIAQNGVGKSNFLNAITWCLYEEETHLQDKTKALPIVNTQTIDETDEKDSMVVSVQIKIEVNNEDIVIRREAKYVKNSNIKNSVLKTESRLMLKKKNSDNTLGYDNPDVLYDENATSYVERLFPHGISQYFFFDNEQMNNYFQANSGGSIEKAINEISKISLVQNIISRLKSVESDYKVDLGSNDEIINKLQENAAEKEKTLNDEKEALNRIKDQLNAGLKEIERLDNEVKGVESLKTLERERELVATSLENEKKDIAELESNLSDFVVRNETLIRMYPSFVKTLELIEEKNKAKQMPPEISIEMLKKSKDNRVCELCGNDIDEKHLAHIVELLNRYNVAPPIFELLLSIKHKVTELKDEADKYPENRDKLLMKMEEKMQMLEKTQTHLNEIITDMKAIPNQEEISRKLDQREFIKKQVNSLSEAKGISIERIKNYEKEFADATDKFEEAINAKEKASVKLTKYNTAKELKNILISVEEDLIREMRNEISVKTFNNFSNLIWKKNTYASVEIDEDYNVDVKHVKGHSAIGSTSAAERALLALSFTNAIHEISGFESPIVIDSPVGRVSDENRRKFAESVAEISKHKQIIMLFTPNEYSKDVSDIFDSIATKSRAKMNESEDITTII